MWRAVDVLGLLPVTEGGNKYPLMAMDYFLNGQKHILWQPGSCYSGRSPCERTCIQIWSTSVHPLRQGCNFESAVFAEVCALLEMVKTRTTPLHPQSDGLVE